MTRTTLSLCASLSALLFLGTPAQYLRAQEEPPAAVTPAAERPADETPAKSDGATQAEPNDGTDDVPESDAKPSDEPTVNGVDGEAAVGKSAEQPRELGLPSDIPAVPAIEENLSPELQRMRERVRGVLSSYYQEPISTGSYSPWGIMHALIAYGVDTEIYDGDRKAFKDIRGSSCQCSRNPAFAPTTRFASKGRTSRSPT